MNHRNVKHCFTGVGTVLIVFAQPSVLPKPAERPFHNPPFGQDDEAFGLIGALDDFQTHLPVAAQQRYPGLQAAGVRAIGPDTAQAGKLMPQDAQQLLGSITILHVGGGHHHSNAQSQGVHEDMALAPVDLLGAIEPVGTTPISCFDGLRVDNARTGLAVASFEHAEVAAQDIIDPFPGAVTTPAPEV